MTLLIDKLIIASSIVPFVGIFAMSACDLWYSRQIPEPIDVMIARDKKSIKK